MTTPEIRLIVAICKLLCFIACLFFNAHPSLFSLSFRFYRCSSTQQEILSMDAWSSNIPYLWKRQVQFWELLQAFLTLAHFLYYLKFIAVVQHSIPGINLVDRCLVYYYS